MVSSDKYSNFEDLAKNEREGVDFQIHTINGTNRNTKIFVFAPHGGGIEPHTSLIAENVADNNFCFYAFEGIKPQDNFNDLHLTSTNFDEPRCLRLIRHAYIAVAIHGKSGKDNSVSVGGRDQRLGNRIIKKLNEAGFNAEKETSPKLNGQAKENICNQTLTGKGVQLEITRRLRSFLVNHPDIELKKFSDAIRQAIYEDERLF